MRSTVTTLIIAACLALASPAMAGSHDTFDAEGAYAGLSFTYGKISDAQVLDNTMGGGFWFGYRGMFVPWLAPELQVDALFAKESVGPGLDAVLAYAVGTVNLRAYPLEALDIQIMDGRIQPYALGGVGVLYARAVLDTGGGGELESTATEVAGRLGAGVDVYLTNSISLLGEVGGLLVGGNGANGATEVLTIRAGVQFQF